MAAARTYGGRVTSRTREFIVHEGELCRKCGRNTAYTSMYENINLGYGAGGLSYLRCANPACEMV